MYPLPLEICLFQNPYPSEFPLPSAWGMGNSCLIVQTIVNLAHNCVNAVGIKIYMKAVLVQFNSICHGKDATWNCENNL